MSLLVKHFQADCSVGLLAYAYHLIFKEFKLLLYVGWIYVSMSENDELNIKDYLVPLVQVTCQPI